MPFGYGIVALCVMDFRSGYNFRLLLMILLFVLFYPFFYTPLLSSSNDDISSVCQDRCSGFSGQAYYQCIETCVRTMKKNQLRGAKKVSQRMQECEEICSVYEGVERVKCLRLCLERNKDK